MPQAARQSLSFFVQAVAYEMRSAALMLASSGSRGDLTDEERLVRDALVEAGMTHCRVLIEFFEPRKSAHDTDLRASWFVPFWYPQPSAAMERLRKALPQIDRISSHLTTHRLPPNDPWSDWRRVVYDAMEVFEEFAALVPDALDPQGILCKTALTARSALKHGGPIDFSKYRLVKSSPSP